MHNEQTLPDEAASRAFGIYGFQKPYAVLDFCGASNVLPTPRRMIKALNRCAAYADKPPDPACAKARANLARHHRLDAENITSGANPAQLLDLALRALRIRRAVLPMPCDLQYRRICKINFCDVQPFMLSEHNNFKIDPDDLIDAIPSKADALIIGNPNVPTGRALSKNALRMVLDYCQSKGIYVIVDEHFADFVPEDVSVAPLVNSCRNLIVLRSLSEFYRLQGLNAAYAVACSEITDLLQQGSMPWTLDVFGSCLCEYAYQDANFERQTKRWIFSERRRVTQQFAQTQNIHIINSDCHILLLCLEELPAETVCRRLRGKNILAEDASVYTGLNSSYLKISLRDKKANDQFTDALLRCLI